MTVHTPADERRSHHSWPAWFAVLGLAATGQAVLVLAILMSDSVRGFSDQWDPAAWVYFLVMLSLVTGFIGVLSLLVALLGALTGAGKDER